MSSISAAGGLTGAEKFLQENTMDLSGVNKKQETEGASSTDFANVDAATKDRDREPSNELTFEDMLQLMIVQLQSQSIDNTADTNDMMNQLISMTVMQSLTTLTGAVEEVQTASVMNYAASLVGKEVTLGVYNEKTKEIEELYGTVEASGTYDGKQVIFVNGESYFLSSIMAVGKLPPLEDANLPSIDGGDDKAEGGRDNEDVENSGAAGDVSGGDSDNSGTGGETEAGVSGAEEAAQV